VPLVAGIGEPNALIYCAMVAPWAPGSRWPVRPAAVLGFSQEMLAVPALFVGLTLLVVVSTATDSAPLQAGQLCPAGD
jgi:hypothetical protein